MDHDTEQLILHLTTHLVLLNFFLIGLDAVEIEPVFHLDSVVVVVVVVVVVAVVVVIDGVMDTLETYRYLYINIHIFM